MTTTRNFPWPRIVAEGVTIVVSILLAFWIQAWWEARQDREDEIDLLGNLLEEFLHIKASIEDIRDYQVAILESAYKLVDFAEQPNVDVNDEEVDQLLSDITWVSSPANFSAPILNAIYARGDDRLISNRRLRARLILLPHQFNWIRESMQDDLDFMKGYMEPFLYQHGSILHLAQVEGTRPGTSGFVFPAPPVKPRTTYSHRAVLQKREFQNLVLQRAVILEDIVSLARYPELPVHIDEIIELIQRELDQYRP